MAEQKKRLKDLLAQKAKEAYDAIPVVGNGHLTAMGRLGLAELRQAFSFGAGSVEQPTPPGIFGSPTQGEIAQARGGPGSGPEQEAPQKKLSMDDLRAYADARAKEAEQRMEHGRQRERERGGMEM